MHRRSPIESFSEAVLHDAGSQLRKVLVVSGVRLVAESLSRVLDERGLVANFEVPGSGQEWSGSPTWDLHLVLVDADLFEHEELWRRLEELRADDVPIVAMATRVDAGTLDICLSGGASTLLSMESPLDHFVESLLLVLADRSLVEKRARRQLAQLRETEARASFGRTTPFDFLTRHEGEVLGEIMRGRSAEEIANESWVAMSTVRSQIKSILQKLGVNSQVAAVALARETDWSPDKARRGSRTSGPRVRGSRVHVVRAARPRESATA